MQNTHNAAHLDDAELVDKINKTSNTTLFALLYDRYSNKVYHKCLSFVKSPEEAQDLTHDIFIRLYLKLKMFKGNSKFSTWLYAITYNYCLNYLERDKKKKDKTIVNSNELVETNQEVEEISDHSIFEMKTDKLQIALASLEPDEKSILLMKYQDDFSIKDIMETFEIGESASKMRLNRAKKKLIEKYDSLN